MKPNPGNYESWKDPEGGEWIKMKNGIFRDIVWRPVDMKMDEANGNKISFTCEFFGEIPQRMDTFEKSATAVIQDILTALMEENQNVQ